MPERGATPKVSRTARRLVRATRPLASPFELDDYLEQFNPLWSTRELRGRIESVDRETADAVTVTIRPGHDWPGHEPGQFVRIGFDIDGVRHWRAYSLTSDPDREDGNISITVKTVDEGRVSRFLAHGARPGTIVTLSDVEGEYILPDPPPEKFLFISAGSGVGWRSATRASASTSSTRARWAAWGRTTSTTCAPTGASGSPTFRGRQGSSTRSRSTGRSTETSHSSTSSASRSSSARARPARAALSSSTRATARRRRTAIRRSSWPARSWALSCHTAAARASATRASANSAGAACATCARAMSTALRAR